VQTGRGDDGRCAVRAAVVAARVTHPGSFIHRLFPHVIYCRSHNSALSHLPEKSERNVARPWPQGLGQRL
jgi:hypothetical protein